MFFFYYCNTLTVVGGSGEAHIMDDLSWSIRAKERPTLAIVYILSSRIKEKHSAPGQIQERETMEPERWIISQHTSIVSLGSRHHRRRRRRRQFFAFQRACKYDLLTAEKRLQSLSLSYFSSFF